MRNEFSLRPSFRPSVQTNFFLFSSLTKKKKKEEKTKQKEKKKKKLRAVTKMYQKAMVLRGQKVELFSILSLKTFVY
jgi:hypothetical protein